MLLTIVILPLVLCGCRNRPSPPTFTIQGSILCDGKAVTGNYVVFWPQNLPKGKDSAEEDVEPVSAVIDAQGGFHVACQEGTYKVTVSPRLPQGVERRGPEPGMIGQKGKAPSGPSVPPVYWSESTTPLEVKVEKGGETNFTLNVVKGSPR
jgi:hypothetical protein